MTHRLLKESISILKSNNPRSEQEISFLTSQLKNFDYFDVIKYNLDFESKLKVCAKLLCYQHFKAGETIFLKGSKELNFYLIFGGNISVVVDKTPEELEAEIQSRQLLEQATQDYQKGNLVMQEIAKKTITRVNAELKYKYQFDQQRTLLGLNNPDILKNLGECGVLSVKQINILTHNKSFGELSMTTNQNRTASVFALTEVDLAYIKESDYRHLFKEQIDIGLFMVDTMSLLLGQDAERSEVGEFSYYFKTKQIPYKKAFYSEGDEAKHMYLIKQGQVELKITGPNKKELPLSLLGVGQFFGHEQGVEMGLVRTCSAICATNDTVVCEVGIEQVMLPMFNKFATIFRNQAAQSQQWVKKRKNMIISNQKVKTQSSQRAIEQRKKQEEQQLQEQQQQKESIKNSNEFLLAMIKMRDSERLLKQSFNSSSALDKSPHKSHLQKQFSMVLDEQSLESLSPRKSTRSTFRKSQLKSMDELITELNIQKDQQSQVYPTTTTGFCVSMNLSTPKLKSSLSCSPRKLKLRLHKESDVSPNEQRQNNQDKTINESTNEYTRNMSQVDFTNAIQTFENRNYKKSNEVNVSFSKQTSEHISETSGDQQLQKPSEPQETRPFSPFKIHNTHRKAESMVVFSQLPKNPSNKSLLKEKRNQQIQVPTNIILKPLDSQTKDQSMNSPELNLDLSIKRNNSDGTFIDNNNHKNTINNISACDFTSIHRNIYQPLHIEKQACQQDSSINAGRNNSNPDGSVISNRKEIQSQGSNDNNPIIYVSQINKNHSKTFSSHSPLKVLTALSSLKEQQQQQSQLHTLSPTLTPPPVQQTIPSASRKIDTIRMNASQSLKIQIQRLAEKKKYPKETNGIAKQIETRIEAISGGNPGLPSLSPYLKRTLKLDTEESNDFTIKNPSQTRLFDLSTRKKDSMDLSNNQQLNPPQIPLLSPQLPSDNNQTSRLQQPSLSQHQQARQQTFINLKHIDENKVEMMRIHNSLLMKKNKIRNISNTIHSISTDPGSCMPQSVTNESDKLKLDDTSLHIGASAVNSFQLKHFFPKRDDSEKKKMSSGFQTEFFSSRAMIKHSSQNKYHLDATNETIVEGHSFSSELLQPKGEDSFQVRLAKAIRKKQHDVEDVSHQQQEQQQILSASQLKQFNLDKKPLNPQVFSLKKIPMLTPSKRAKIFQQSSRLSQDQQPSGLLSVSTVQLPAQQH